jgi:hypothetical protein
MTSHFYSYAYWIDAAYLVHNLLYPGPPDNEIYEKLFQRYGLRTEDVIEKFGLLDVEPMRMDHLLNDWESIKSLKVVHTPGRSPGHMSLYYEEEKRYFGGLSEFSLMSLYYEEERTLFRGLSEFSLISDTSKGRRRSLSHYGI